jgi:hypothetical protein
MFQFTEPSLGQFLKQSTFSECVHYGIAYCLQVILTLNNMLNFVGRYIIRNMYKNFCQSIFIKIFKIMLAYIGYIYIYIYIYILRVNLKLLSDGVSCICLQPILSVISRVLNSWEPLTSIFLPSWARQSSNLRITR